MELLILGSITLVTFATCLSAVEEQTHWLKSYWDAGEEDREYQRAKQSTPPYKTDYRE